MRDVWRSSVRSSKCATAYLHSASTGRSANRSTRQTSLFHLWKPTSENSTLSRVSVKTRGPSLSTRKTFSEFGKRTQTRLWLKCSTDNEIDEVPCDRNLRKIHKVPFSFLVFRHLTSVVFGPNFNTISLFACSNLSHGDTTFEVFVRPSIWRSQTGSGSCSRTSQSLKEELRASYWCLRS